MPIQRTFSLPHNFTIRNHYVPQWYQRRFFTNGSKQSKLLYLDLDPDVIRRPDGSTTTRRAIRPLGPINCFKQDHLYTQFFGEYASDAIEKKFFGKFDAEGEKAVDFFGSYSMQEGLGDAIRNILNYLAAQLFRTPKMLELIRRSSKAKEHQGTLLTIQGLWPLFHTTWAESIWEIVNCNSSQTKFIVSDAPVATYNKKVFPQSDEVCRVGIAFLERLGTHTIFPLDANHCLILTNLQYALNPKVNPLNDRKNISYFESRKFNALSLQHGREIGEQEVIAINYILKKNSWRYIAASEEEWLYPERYLKERFWPRLGGPLFLHPDPRKILLGVESLPSLQKISGSVKWQAFQAARKAWDERERRLG